MEAIARNQLSIQVAFEAVEFLLGFPVSELCFEGIGSVSLGAKRLKPVTRGSLLPTAIAAIGGLCGGLRGLLGFELSDLGANFLLPLLNAVDEGFRLGDAIAQPLHLSPALISLKQQRSPRAPEQLGLNPGGWRPGRSQLAHARA